jgi:hypothetical protein
MIEFARFTIPQLKEELKKRDLRRTGTKADLVLRLTHFIDSERFTLFPKLPSTLSGGNLFFITTMSSTFMTWGNVWEICNDFECSLSRS